MRVSRRGIGTGTVVVILIVIAALAIGAYYTLGSRPAGSSTTNTTPTTSASSTHTGPSTTVINIASGTGTDNSLSYSPKTLTVLVGTNGTIEWMNSDSTIHSVTFQSVPSGVNATAISDSNLAAGGTYSLTLTVPGTYTYHCIYHSWMTGTIVVIS